MTDIHELNQTMDPRCPGCGCIHPRQKTNGMLVVDTKTCRRKGSVRDCKWRGSLSREDFEKGLKRIEEE